MWVAPQKLTFFKLRLRMHSSASGVFFLPKSQEKVSKFESKLPQVFKKCTDVLQETY